MIENNTTDKKIVSLFISSTLLATWFEVFCILDVQGGIIFETIRISLKFLFEIGVYIKPTAAATLIFEAFLPCLCVSISSYNL